jgi:putative oxidoreductase
MINHRSEWAAFVLRMSLGVLMLAHGLTKLFVFTLPGTVGFFESVGFSGLLAYPVTFAEIIGGALLIVGLQTRWAALAMVPVLLGATSVHWGNGWMFNAPNGGWEFPAFLAAAALTQFILGTDGALSVGAWLKRGPQAQQREALSVTS